MVFTGKMCEKHLWKRDIIDLHFTLNVTLPQRFFAYFASKNQPPGFFISATLSGNGLKLITMVRRKLKFEESVNKIKLSNI